jgi:hypothetical protein
MIAADAQPEEFGMSRVPLILLPVLFFGSPALHRRQASATPAGTGRGVRTIEIDGQRPNHEPPLSDDRKNHDVHVQFG